MRSFWNFLKWIYFSLFVKRKIYGSKTRRSSKWSSLRKQIIEKEKCCAVCGRDKDLEVHHIIPFHKRPDLELEPTNLIVVCSTPCHFVFGHLYNWSNHNENVVKDAAEWKKKIKG